MLDAPRQGLLAAATWLVSWLGSHSCGSVKWVVVGELHWGMMQARRMGQDQEAGSWVELGAVGAAHTIYIYCIHM